MPNLSNEQYFVLMAAIREFKTIMAFLPSAYPDADPKKEIPAGYNYIRWEHVNAALPKLDALNSITFPDVDKIEHTYLPYSTWLENGIPVPEHSCYRNDPATTPKSPIVDELATNYNIQVVKYYDDDTGSVIETR